MKGIHCIYFIRAVVIVLFPQEEAKTQVVVLSQQVTDLLDSQDKSANQLLQLQRSLKQSEQGEKTSGSYGHSQ